MPMRLSDVFRIWDAYIPVVVQALVKTAVVADDDDDEDDAIQFDVIAPHPGYLLLISMGPCSTTELVF